MDGFCFLISALQRLWLSLADMHINKLPDCLLERVLMSVPQTNDLASCSCVCSRWRQLIREVCTSPSRVFSFSKYIPDSFFILFFKPWWSFLCGWQPCLLFQPSPTCFSLQQLSHMSLHSLDSILRFSRHKSSHLIPFFFATHMNLQTPSILPALLTPPSPFLSLASISISYSSDSDNVLQMPTLTNLRRISMDALNFLPIANGLARLSSLSVLDLSLVNLDTGVRAHNSLLEAISHLMSLRHLTLRSWRCCYPLTLLHLTALPNLTYLALQSITDDLLVAGVNSQDVLASLAQLTTLQAFWCNMFLPHGSAPVINSLISLQALTVAVGEEDIPQVAQLTNLTLLHIIAKQPTGGYRRSLPSMTSLSGLQKLYLESFSVYCLEPLIEQLSSTLPNLTVLALWGVNVNEALSSRIRHLTHIQELCLSSPAQIFTRPRLSGCISLHGLTSLKRLALNWVDVDVAAAKEISCLSWLEVLDLEDCRVHDGVMRELGWLPRLAELTLSEHQRTSIKTSGFPRHKISFGSVFM